MIKRYFKSFFKFDEYMRVYLIMFEVGYIVGFFGNLRKIRSIGMVKYFSLMVIILFGGILFLRVFQWICRKVGYEKVYSRIKDIFKNE